MRTKSVWWGGVFLVSACAARPSYVPFKQSAPVAASPLVAPQTEPLLTTDPATIPVPYVLKPDTPPDAKEYWKECQNAKVHLIADEQQKLKALESAQAKQDEIETERSYLKKLYDPYYIVFPDTGMWDAESGPGMIQGRIIQIIDDQNMLVDVDFSYYHAYTGEHETVWISGCSTQNAVDGSPVVGCFIPAGRTQYESATGKRTVHLLKPFDIRDYLIRQ